MLVRSQKAEKAGKLHSSHSTDQTSPQRTIIIIFLNPKTMLSISCFQSKCKTIKLSNPFILSPHVHRKTCTISDHSFSPRGFNHSIRPSIATVSIHPQQILPLTFEMRYRAKDVSYVYEPYGTCIDTSIQRPVRPLVFLWLCHLYCPPCTSHPCNYFTGFSVQVLQLLCLPFAIQDYTSMHTGQSCQQPYSISPPSSLLSFVSQIPPSNTLCMRTSQSGKSLSTNVFSSPFCNVLPEICLHQDAIIVLNNMTLFLSIPH